MRGSTEGFKQDLRIKKGNKGHYRDVSAESVLQQPWGAAWVGRGGAKQGGSFVKLNPQKFDTN